MTLGTDNMSENMFQALNVGIVLNRGLRDDDPPTPTPQTMLDWATQNGAKAVGYGTGIRVNRGGEATQI